MSSRKINLKDATEHELLTHYIQHRLHPAFTGPLGLAPTVLTCGSKSTCIVCEKWESLPIIEPVYKVTVTAGRTCGEINRRVDIGAEECTAATRPPTPPISDYVGLFD